MIPLLRALFFFLIVRPLVTVVLGINIRGAHLLPRSGPAMLAANHNSHLDTLVLMSLFPLRFLPLLRPVAAADYFLRNKALAWFFLNLIGIIPLNRHTGTKDPNPLQPCIDALARGEILILFPEGTRGKPEEMSTFKSGIAHLAKCAPDVPTIPIFMRGCGKALPRGEALLVPNICDINVGHPLRWGGDKAAYMRELEKEFGELADAMRPLCQDEEAVDVDENV
ncbi:MAG: lysophospholipid acyltransferase family protein [Verrucomicrobia bacterium]|nr:lysophospholipid acyltransferase family protein [Verrucomicrobiota bacterium]